MLTKDLRTSPQERQFWALLVMHGRRSASDSLALAATARGRVPDYPSCPEGEAARVGIVGADRDVCA